MIQPHFRVCVPRDPSRGDDALVSGTAVVASWRTGGAVEQGYGRGTVCRCKFCFFLDQTSVSFSMASPVFTNSPGYLCIPVVANQMQLYFFLFGLVRCRRRIAYYSLVLISRLSELTLLDIADIADAGLSVLANGMCERVKD